MNRPTYSQWAAKYPEAAAALNQVIQPGLEPPENSAGKSEAWAQQNDRMRMAKMGVYSWRNNVGATPAKIEMTCPRCAWNFTYQQTPIRYGLANDSAKLNKQIKSSDLILAIPRLVTPAMVGQTIAQFGSIEEKRPGWVYTGKDQEEGQAAWLALVNKIGGYGCFSTGGFTL